jgi:hypothetical protein
MSCQTRSNGCSLIVWRVFYQAPLVISPVGRVYDDEPLGVSIASISGEVVLDHLAVLSVLVW